MVYVKMLGSRWLNAWLFALDRVEDILMAGAACALAFFALVYFAPHPVFDAHGNLRDEALVLGVLYGLTTLYALRGALGDKFSDLYMGSAVVIGLLEVVSLSLGAAGPIAFVKAQLPIIALVLIGYALVISTTAEALAYASRRLALWAYRASGWEARDQAYKVRSQQRRALRQQLKPFVPAEYHYVEAVGLVFWFATLFVGALIFFDPKLAATNVRALNAQLAVFCILLVFYTGLWAGITDAFIRRGYKAAEAHTATSTDVSS